MIYCKKCLLPSTKPDLMFNDNGSEYNIDYWAPPVGLFGVTVYQAYLSAVDEV